MDCVMPLDRFEQQMEYLHTNGYHCLSLPEIFDHSVDSFPREKCLFTLTFDDGFDDFFTWAYPVLHKYGFTATVFLVVDALNGCSNWDGDEGSRMLTWECIRELGSNGISFGSHTCTHAHLPFLSEDDIWQEIYASRDTLEMKLGNECTLFAYPFGESTPKIRRLVRSAGYKAAFGVMTGRPGTYNWWRSECTPQDTPADFSFKLTWSHNFIQKTRGWLREETLVGRFLRKMKYRWLSRTAQPVEDGLP